MRQEIPNNEANVLSFTLAAALIGLMFCFGVFGFFALHIGYGAMVGGSLLALYVLIWRIRQHDERGWRIVERWEQSQEAQNRPQQQVIIRSPGREWVFVETDKSRQYIFQPSPGVFANFLREVIDINNRVQFSKRQAMERGWREEEYEAMAAQLRAVGWLTAQVVNGAPTVYQHRVDDIRKWLSDLPPHYND